MPSSVICISHARGAGGEDIGRALARQLGYRYVDDDIVRIAAEREGVPDEVIADAERRKSFLRRLVEDLGSAGTLDVGLPYAGIRDATPSDMPFAEQHHRDLIQDVIHEVADAGGAVIVSHAASIALAGRSGVLRVFVTASPHVRAGRWASDLGLDRQDAEKAMKESDAARADYFKRFYGIDRELPTHYDLVVSTDLLTAEQATALISHAVGLAP
jgi:cytidylate kinase